MSVDHAQAPSTFHQLGLPEKLTRTLAKARITVPTPVQAAVLPDALAGRDVLGKAATGSGKTLAFGLPILVRLAGSGSKPKSPRALIVVPTRELAGQVRESLEPFAHAMNLKLATVYGGTPYDRQIKRLRAGVDIVVATPGRLDDLIKRGSVSLDRVQVTVLDEADHLCDLGFFPAVSALVSMTPDGGQRMLLSATLDGDVDKLVRKHLVNPVTHDCDPTSDKPDLTHHVLVTAAHDKVDSAVHLLRANPRSIVFTRTRHGATNLARALTERGVSAVDLHGNLTQGARERNLRKFRTGQADVVVATDVAARGIHVDGVTVVVHYDAPTEAKAFTHRSGRTARAGNSGAVVTMTTPNQVGSVARLHKTAGVTSRHHDTRTAPDPMTADALSTAGIASEDVVVSSENRSGGGGGRNQRSGGARSYGQAKAGGSSSRGRRPQQRDQRSSSSRGERPGASEYSSRPERSRPERTSRKPGAGSGLPKARWTASDKKKARSSR